MSESKQATEEKRAENEEVSKCLEDTRKVRPATQREPGPHIKERPSKPQVLPTKPRIALNVPIKRVKQLGISQPQPPRLKAKLRGFVRPKLLSVEIQPAIIVAPTISTASKATTLADIRVPTLMPIILRGLATPLLRLRLKLPLDISVRPIIYPNSIKDMGPLMSIIKPTRVVFQRPQLEPSVVGRSSTLCMTKIRVVPIVKEEMEKVAYKLKKMGFSERFIAECLKRAYGKTLDLKEISSVIERGEAGQIEAMGPLPKEVSDAIDALVAEKRQAVARTREAKVTAISIAEPEEPFAGEIGSVFELFLDEKSGKGVGGAVRYSGESIYIVLEKPLLDEHQCLDTFHYFCVRALREYLGEKAETRALSSGYGVSEVEKHLGESDVTIVDEKLLSQKLGIRYRKSGEKLLMEVDERAIADRLKNFSKGLSYVIFHVKPEKAELLYKKLWSFRSAFHDKIFWIAPKPELSLDTIRRLAKIMWGFLDIPPLDSWDKLFGTGKTTYYETLERIGELVTHKLEKPYPIPRTHRLGSESREHLLIKEFLAKCLVDGPSEQLLISKALREDRYKYIEFEKEWREENQLVVVSDAYIENDGVAVEVETLFEEGKYGGDPVTKIRDETVQKYRRYGIPVRELWIVIENITMLRHLRELWELRDLYRRWYEERKIGFQVKFFTLNLEDEKLVQMEKVIKSLRNILRG